MAHLLIPLELTKISRVTRKTRGSLVFPASAEKRTQSGLFFFVVYYQIGRYFTFEGGNVQFILSPSKHTTDLNTCARAYRALLAQRGLKIIPNKYESCYFAALDTALGAF